MEKWDPYIQELEEFFSKTELPKGPIRVTKFAVINDLDFFVNGHLSIVKANNGNRYFLQYLQRLVFIKKMIEDDKKSLV